MSIRFVRSFVGEAISHLFAKFERRPIDTVAQLFQFASQKAAFIGQKKLYGYLKTRIGTRYPSMFEDEIFVQSVNIAKMHVFAACLSDLSLHAVARGTMGAGLDRRNVQEMAVSCFRAGLADNRDAMPGDADTERKWLEDFHERLKVIHWENLAADGDSFNESPKALYRWAPIADELKRLDREIVENSIRFAWTDVIRDFRERAVPAAIAADWRANHGNDD